MLIISNIFYTMLDYINLSETLNSNTKFTSNNIYNIYSKYDYYNNFESKSNSYANEVDYNRWALHCDRNKFIYVDYYMNKEYYTDVFYKNYNKLNNNNDNIINQKHIEITKNIYWLNFFFVLVYLL